MLSGIWTGTENLSMSIKSIIDGVKFNFQNFFAFLIVACCFCYFFWISGNKAATNNHNIGEIKTALISLVMLVVGYYFGSSKSSARKDEVISDMQQTIAKNE